LAPLKPRPRHADGSTIGAPGEIHPRHDCTPYVRRLAMRGSVSRRRRQFIVEGFQGRFVLAQLVWLTLFLLAFVAVLFAGPAYALWRGDASERFDAALLFLRLHEHVWPAVAVLFCLATFVTIRQSHRIAGPLYRLRWVCEQVTAGRLFVSARVRRGDYLIREAEAFEIMLGSLRERVGRAQAALTAVDEYLQSPPPATTPSWPDLQYVAQLVTKARADLAGLVVTSPADTQPSNPVHVPAAQATRPKDSRDNAGFTLLEMFLVCAIIATLTAIAVPAYLAVLNGARVAKAIGDIRAFDREIAAYYVLNGCLPDTLSDIGKNMHRDPWSRPYEYQVVSQKGGKGADGCLACRGTCVPPGHARKDHSLIPINSDFDLFSLGADGKSSSPLTAKASQDDIVRGSDGAFVGLGRDY
jgi:general secretion pathway protein G